MDRRPPSGATSYYYLDSQIEHHGGMPRSPELQRLRRDHGPAVLAFETVNRTYFASSISDRGDEYFDQFADKWEASLAEQETGRDAYYVLLSDDGSVVGRFNLRDIEDGMAELGYRIARQFSGQGLATAAVRELCRLANSEHGVRTLRAKTNHENVASQRVLTKAGFQLVGIADDVGGRPGVWYELNLDRTQRDAQ